MRAVILGTGWWSPRRAGPGHLVSVGGSHLLFDCGKEATTQAIKAGANLTEIKHLFFTHHHVDHNMDFIQFAFGSWISGRGEPLNVFGPTGTRKLVDALVGPDGALSGDIESRVRDAGRPREGIQMNVTEVTEAGLVHAADGWSVSAMRTRHVDSLESWAYRIDSEEGSIVYSGDTRPLESMSEFARDADLLIHECSATDEIIRARGFGHIHTSARELGKIAAAAEVKKVALVHFLFRGMGTEADDREELAQLVPEVEESFDGAVILSEDLEVIEI